ncbi:arsenical pump membrane protein [Cellulomonas hominis]|uniref:Arsenical pump membrane protein n=1 Tax=Cellulomonas hominis TaxID=156981 RepID=A0A7W8W8V0_9CELL|nr:SLC13 family permease [Cellulomonas hominis]MBB5471827.1 arsenical pump membrane protein [Cellulomonas hominis]
MSRRRSVPWWAVAVGVAALLVVTGVLPRADAAALAERVGPVLVFVAALTVVAELCGAAGLFDVATDAAARSAGGRRWVLWLLLVGIAVVSTVLLSLDTTAVLLTPLAITLARRTGTSPLLLVLTVVALANTASLLLPVSNLTNLLADHRFTEAGAGYLGVMWAPALAAVVVTVAVLAVRGRADLRGRFDPGPRYAPPDRGLLLATGATTAVMAVGFVAGLPVWAVAVGAAAVLVGAFAVRRRPLPGRARDLVPWRMLLVVAALFVAVETLQVRGLGEALADVAPAGGGAGALLGVAGLSAGAANLLNNLPAYLVLEPVAGGDPLRLAAVLIGTGVGPLLTPWASLATVLWWRRCRQALVHVPVRAFLVQGLWLAPLCVGAATLALVVAR